MDGQLPLGFIGSCLSSVLLSSVSVRIKSICVIFNYEPQANLVKLLRLFLTVLCVSNIIGVSSPQLINSSFYRFSSLPVQLYLVDSFTYAASATSAAGVSFSLLLIFCVHLIYGRSSSSSGRCLDLRSHYSLNRCSRNLGWEGEILYVFFKNNLLNVFQLNHFFLHTTVISWIGYRSGYTIPYLDLL